MRTIKLAVPCRPNRSFAEAAPVSQVLHSVAVELPDYRDVLMELVELQELHYMENTRVDTVVMGARAYLALREYVKESSSFKRVCVGNGGYIEFDGTCIYMDPSRDDGPMVPLFAERDAINLYVLAKASR